MIELANKAAAEIADLRNRQESIYLQSPKELVSHSNQERQTKRDYRGREILELLQNADDAAAESSVPGRLLFRLSESRLIVANTGAPFTADGIESVVVSHVSPKQFSRQRHIGSKGLGFRSVLNWTDRPLIMSGPYAVAFDPEFARERIENLCARSDVLRSRWNQLQQARGENAVPVLRFPYVPSVSHPDIEAAQRLLADGYDTVLVFPFLQDFDERTPYETLGEQLDQLGPEILLFCRQLTEVAFEEDEYEPQRWEVDRERANAVLAETSHNRVCLSAGGEAHLWSVHTRSGSLPPELARRSPDTPDFEVAVAVPESSAHPAQHRLCVFFPTDEEIPSTCVHHATLLLEANRKHPISDDAVNKFVLGELAKLWVDVAVSESKIEPERGLQLLEGAQSVSSGLAALGFRDCVLTTARAATLFPRLDGQVTSILDVVRPPTSEWSSLLHPDWSGEALSNEAETAAPGLIDSLDASWYEPEALATRLERWTSSLPAAEAGKVLGRLLALKAVPDPAPALLRLENGERADGTLNTYLPKEDVSVTLPQWVHDFAFLDSTFVEGARETSGLRTLRSLVDRLEGEGYLVREFNAESVTRHLVQELDSLSEEHKFDRPAAVRDVLATVLPLVEAELEGRSLGVSVPVLTTTGRVRPARECYLSDAYPNGQLVHALYDPLGEDEFVAGPEQLGLSMDPSRIEMFLMRLGVAHRPRETAIAAPYQLQDSAGYKRFVLESLTYPYTADDVAIASVQQAIQDIDIKFHNLTMPQRWPEVLEHSDPNAILSYVAGIGDHHLSIAGQSSATLGVNWRHQHKARFRSDVRFPSPAYYLLRSKSWVPCTDGSRRRPGEVVVGPGVRRQLAGFLGEPKFDLRHPMLSQFAARDLVREVLSRLGAFQSFADLDVHARFELLRLLPTIDPEGKQAPGIYGALLEEHAVPPSKDYVQGFIATGTMWGRRGDEEGYWPVNAIRYSVEATLPEPVRRHVALVAIPPRKSATEVEAIYGVRRLARDDYSLSIDETLTVERPWSSEAESWLRTLVPALYAYRLSVREDDGRERRRFTDIRLRVCEAIGCSVKIGTESSTDFVTESFASMAADGTLYVISHQASFVADPLFCDAVSDALADHLGVPAEASALAGFLACQTPSTALALLDRRTGGRAEEFWRRAIEQLKWEDDVPAPIRLPATTAEESVGHVEIGRDTVDTESAEPARQRGEEDDELEASDKARFEVGDAPQRRPGKKVSWKQQRSADRDVTHRVIAQQGVTLQIAEEFEIENGRFPMRVHTAVGSEAFGCDIISFESEDERTAAQAACAVDPARVVRFIEVKGRSNRSGAVELTENEQDAARRMAERYFIYRVFVSGTRDVELAVLGSPVESKAFQPIIRYEYALIDSPQTEWFVRKLE